MSVTFNLRTPLGVDYPIHAICYGVLRSFPFTGADFNYQTQSAAPEIPGEDIVDSTMFSHIEYVLPSGILRKCSQDSVDIYAHLKAMYADLPMFGGIARVMPQKGVVRVSLNHQPADKVMLALFFARTLCYAFNTRNSVIRQSLESGNGYRESMVLSMVESYTGNYIFKFLGESNLFNPNTFGMISAAIFMRQDMFYKPWVQADFHSSGPNGKGGYCRDFDLELMGAIFNPIASKKVEDDDEPGYEEYWYGPKTDTRKMVDCFSIPNDTQILSTGQRYIEDEGFMTVEGTSRDYMEFGLNEFQDMVNTLKSYRGD